MSAAGRQLSADRIAEFGELLRLTEALRTQLESGEWGRAADLELERRRIVNQVFDVAPSASELPVLTATLREVVRINDELIGLAEHRRRALARELELFALGREANRAYDATRHAQQGAARP
jgi:Flagellar protein FliT